MKYEDMNPSIWGYCKEEPDLIENFEKAKSDNFKGWICHHRMETHRRNGKLRATCISRQDLIDWDLYYHRPASELIFLTNSDHTKLHNTTGKHMPWNKGLKGVQTAWNKGQNISGMTGKHFTDSHKNKTSLSHRGLHKGWTWKTIYGQRKWMEK